MLAVLANSKKYGVVAVDPQLAGSRALVDTVLKDLRSLKLDRIVALEGAWMSLHGPRGLTDLPEMESNASATYGDICDGVDSLKHLLSPDDG